MRKVVQIDGFLAAAVPLAFGVAAIVMGVNGRNTVHKSLQQELIVGSPDMTPALIRAEAKKAGLPSTISLPTASIAGKAINSGSRARTFASYMRVHALEASGGLTYSQMPQFATQDGKGTNDPAKALQSGWVLAHRHSSARGPAALSPCRARDESAPTDPLRRQITSVPPRTPAGV